MSRTHTQGTFLENGSSDGTEGLLSPACIWIEILALSLHLRQCPCFLRGKDIKFQQSSILQGREGTGRNTSKEDNVKAALRADQVRKELFDISHSVQKLKPI